MQTWRYWGDLNYWRWRWRHAGPNARALPVLLAALGCGAVGYLIAGGVSEPDIPGGGALTIVRTVRAAGNSSTATPPARTVRVVSRETIVRTATERTLRT